MCTLARPVRVDARLAWNVATPWSIRCLRSAERSLSAGLPAMNELAIVSSSEKAIANGYSTKTGGTCSLKVVLGLRRLGENDEVGGGLYDNPLQCLTGVLLCLQTVALVFLRFQCRRRWRPPLRTWQSGRTGRSANCSGKLFGPITANG